jgi:hypothetical protein
MRARKLAAWSLMIATGICPVLMIIQILSTMEYLSEPYKHEGQLEALRNNGIFWTCAFGVLTIVFFVAAVRVSRGLDFTKPKS